MISSMKSRPKPFNPKTPADDIKDLEVINWHPINESSTIGLYQQPRLSQVPLLKKLHEVTYVVTIMPLDKRAQDLGETICAHGLKWLNIPVLKGKLMILKDPVSVMLMREGLEKVKKDLTVGKERVLIHCAHGLHRTGVFTYALIRSFNITREKTLETIRKLRSVTYEKVGSSRIDFAEVEYIEEREGNVSFREKENISSPELKSIYPSGEFQIYFVSPLRKIEEKNDETLKN